MSSPKRLSGLQTLHALGWRNSIQESREQRKREMLSGGAAADGGVNIFDSAGQRISKAATSQTAPPTKTITAGAVSAVKNITRAGPEAVSVRGSGRAGSPGKRQVQTASVNPRALAQTRVATAEGEVGRIQRRLKTEPLSRVGGGWEGEGDSKIFDTSIVDTALATSNRGLSTYQDSLRYQYSALTTGSSTAHGQESTGAYPFLVGQGQSPSAHVSHTHTPSTLPIASGVKVRGATKPVMGLPTTVGSVTAALAGAAGRRSIQGLALAQERQLLHLTQDDPTSQQGGSLSLSNRHQHQYSVSDMSLLGSPSPKRPRHDTHTNSPPSPSPSTYCPGNSSWSRLRSDVSSLTGPRTAGGFLSARSGAGNTRKHEDVWSHTLHGQESYGGGGGGKTGQGGRERPWPVRTKTHFKMKYSWLAQPMLQEAAGQVYSEEMRLKKEREAAELAKKNVKAKKLPFLQRLRAYNEDDVSTVSSLTQLQAFQKTTALSIRDERLRAEPLKHPYPWA